VLLGDAGREIQQLVPHARQLQKRLGGKLKVFSLSRRVGAEIAVDCGTSSSRDQNYFPSQMDRAELRAMDLRRQADFQREIDRGIDRDAQRREWGPSKYPVKKKWYTVSAAKLAIDARALRVAVAHADDRWHRVFEEWTDKIEPFYGTHLWPPSYFRLLGTKDKHYKERFILWAFLVVNGMKPSYASLWTMAAGSKDASAGAYGHVLGLEKGYTEGRLARYTSYDITLRKFAPLVP